MTMTKNKTYRINNATAVWSNLSSPDDFRGSRKHDISVVISKEQYDEMKALCGADKLAGVREGKEGDLIAKAKSTVFVKEGKERYEKVYDSTGSLCTTFIGGGDVVNVNVSLYEYQPGLFTIMLNGVQLVKKNEKYEGAGSGSGFDVVEGGYVADAGSTADAASAPAVDDLPTSGDAEELPF